MKKVMVSGPSVLSGVVCRFHLMEEYLACKQFSTSAFINVHPVVSSQMFACVSSDRHQHRPVVLKPKAM